jgi:Mg-chelatase subunit ChlD
MRTTRQDTTNNAGAAGQVRRIAGTTRRGSTTIWGAISMGALMTVGALVVDGALLFSSHADLQAAADAAALAGASGLVHGPDTAKARATEFAGKNVAGGEFVSVNAGDVIVGDWDPDTRTFTPSSGSDEWGSDAVSVTARLSEANGNPLRLAFAQMFGPGDAEVAATSIAMYRPRDIVLVLDLSGSMNYDSQIRHIPYLGQDAVEANLYQIWQELGSNTYGTMGFETRYISSDNDDYVRNMLGLYGVPYPYPSGSWGEYINYVQGDSRLRQNGYRKDYGGLTFVNYLLDKRREHWQTPDLQYVSAQPITALKNGVDIFLDYMRDVATDDRVGLSVYTYSDGHAYLEHPLTSDMDAVRATTWARQAAHYDPMTNIGAGMQVGRQELEQNGRSGALKTIILFTDGQANQPGDTATARSFVMDEAYAAADSGISVLTISLGANADSGLMQSVADIANGEHFNVPGGVPVSVYDAELREVFEEIARKRPLRLVH